MRFKYSRSIPAKVLSNGVSRVANCVMVSPDVNNGFYLYVCKIYARSSLINNFVYQNFQIIYFLIL